MRRGARVHVRACACAVRCDVVHTITRSSDREPSSTGSVCPLYWETIAEAAWVSTWGLLPICTSPFSFFHGLSTARIMQQLFYMLAAYSRPARPCIYNCIWASHFANKGKSWGSCPCSCRLVLPQISLSRQH